MPRDFVQAPIPGTGGGSMPMEGEEFRALILRFMPDTETHDLVVAVFEAGRELGGTNYLGIFLDAMRDTAASWFPAVAERRRGRL